MTLREENEVERKRRGRLVRAAVQYWEEGTQREWINVRGDHLQERARTRSTDGWNDQSKKRIETFMIDIAG